MGTIEVSAEDLHHTLSKIHEGLAAQVQPLAALAELLQRPQPVVPVPGDEWAPQTITLGDTDAHRVAPRDLTRLRVLLLNSGTQDVYLTSDKVYLATQPGGKLPVGAAVTLTTTAPVWVNCPTASIGAPGTITVIVEWRDAGGPAPLPKI